MTLKMLGWEHLRETVQNQYEIHMLRYPQKKGEVDAYLQGRDEALAFCLRYLYGHMTANDVLSVSAACVAGYAEASLDAYERYSYVRGIPPEIFLPYVLYHRVNTEWIDGSRGELMAALDPFVRGKTMEEAALAVNVWCCAHATYTPADDRTLGPLAVLRRTMGRCGEESVLAVAALRSVGIPARQCYCPRWSHCDDNHAWVEAWVAGDWHYLGACEPEPVLDRGWFTAAASRAMLVHTKQWGHFSEETQLHITPTYQQISCTARYAQMRKLTVQVQDQGKPQQGVPVAFQIVNYSELFTLHQGVTDEKGRACFETGLGDLCVYVWHNGKMLLQKVDMRTQKDVLVMDLCFGTALDQLPGLVTMDLVPPLGKSDVQPLVKDPSHEQKLRACHEHRAGILAGFAQPEGDTLWDRAIRASAGNWPQIQAFREDGRYAMAEKEAVLQTLRPKDLVDITCAVLTDALDATAGAWQEYDEDVVRQYVLAPRIADEMLLPRRADIRALFPYGFGSARQIASWMRQHMQILQEGGIWEDYPDAYGCLRYRQVPSFAYDFVFVALCRAFGIPARLDSATGEGQWLDYNQQWRNIRSEAQGEIKWLTLENPGDVPLQYQTHISIGKWDGQQFVTLRYPELVIEDKCALPLEVGLYRILTTTRQIDGTASVAVQYLQLNGDRVLPLVIPEDQTAQRLGQISLKLSQGPVKDWLKEVAGRRAILIFADPGSEPTEHLLREMLESADGFREAGCAMDMFLEKPEDLTNPTLQAAQAALPHLRLRICRDPEGEACLHRLLQVGDLRLPFVVTVDEKGRGVYASANYNIGMAQTLLRIQALMKQ